MDYNAVSQSHTQIAHYYLLLSITICTILYDNVIVIVNWT